MQLRRDERHLCPMCDSTSHFLNPTVGSSDVTPIMAAAPCARTSTVINFLVLQLFDPVYSTHYDGHSVSLEICGSCVDVVLEQY